MRDQVKPADLKYHRPARKGTMPLGYRLGGASLGGNGNDAGPKAQQGSEPLEQASVASVWQNGNKSETRSFSAIMNNRRSALDPRKPGSRSPIKRRPGKGSPLRKTATEVTKVAAAVSRSTHVVNLSEAEIPTTMHKTVLVTTTKGFHTSITGSKTR